MKLVQQLLAERGANLNQSFTVVLGFGCYLQGVKTVIDCSPEQITLTVQKSKVTLQGKNLTVAEYFQGDMFITGEIIHAQVD